MSKFECLIVIDKNSSQEEKDKMIKHMTKLINSRGKITNVIELGIINYKADKKDLGIVFQFKAERENAEKIEKAYQKNEKILYHLMPVPKEKML